jgi:hypothetical protein
MLVRATTRNGSVYLVHEERRLAKCVSSKRAVPSRRMQWREYDLIEIEVGESLRILWSDKSGVLQTSAITDVELVSGDWFDEN